MLNNQPSKKKVMYIINVHDKASSTTFKMIFEDLKEGGRGGILSFQCFVESPERLYLLEPSSADMTMESRH